MAGNRQPPMPPIHHGQPDDEWPDDPEAVMAKAVPVAGADQLAEILDRHPPDAPKTLAPPAKQWKHLVTSRNLGHILDPLFLNTLLIYLLASLAADLNSWIVAAAGLLIVLSAVSMGLVVGYVISERWEVMRRREEERR